MAEKDSLRQIERIKIEWQEAFEHMQRYYESESFKSFKIKYDVSIWYQFKNPALIFPVEREMRFSTPNQPIRFAFYPSILANVRAEMTYKEVSKELEKMGYTTMIGDSRYKPEDSVDLRWLKLDYAIERVKKIISLYEHKASHSNYYCYADMADALRRLYEKERTACGSYI
jgi:hypothetical protein